MLSILLSAFASWILLAFLIPRFRFRLIDQPNSRSSHSRLTPRGGGAVFVFVSISASFIAFVANYSSHSNSYEFILVPLMGLPLSLVGFIDDLQSLPAGFRYVVQLLTAFLVSLGSPLLAHSFYFYPTLLFLLFAVTAVINFTNFMDGLDGLVAGCMIVLISVCSIQLVAPWPIWALVGSLMGFLIWNWSPAKVFMGDVGSTFLGTVFAALVLKAPNWHHALALLLTCTPLLGDACSCVLRRLFDRQRIFQAHRLHLFQRLNQAGWSHSRVSSLYIAATAVLAMAFLWGGLPWVTPLAVLELLIGIWLDQQVAVPFVVASRS
ncbi:glycosyl transferase 4 family protein [Synechococcus sp. MEDNS5]|nr:glycosyl transferase 4 family protein [Synechococcus sp. MEDNS5]